MQHFRDQCIDGSGLPLLTEDHLVNSLGMKLGPALKLRSVLAKKLGGPCPCVSCVAQVQQVLALQTGGGMTAVTAAATKSDSSATCSSKTAIDCSNISSVGGCNSHLSKNSLTTNSSSNSSVNRNEENATALTSSSTNNISTNNTNVCNNNDGSTSNTPRSNSNFNTNVANFSSSPPASSSSSSAQQQQQHSPSEENICNNSNSTTNRHDNVDSSS